MSGRLYDHAQRAAGEHLEHDARAGLPAVIQLARGRAAEMRAEAERLDELVQEWQGALPSPVDDPRPGELCDCGQPAVTVFLTPKYGRVPSCRK